MRDEQTHTLSGWKQIAAHLGREIRTVQRWEKQNGLPVRRLPGARRGTVYISVEELDRWLRSPESPERRPSPEPDTIAEPEPQAPSASAVPSPRPQIVWRLPGLVLAVAAVVLVGAAAAFQVHLARKAAPPAAASPVANARSASAVGTSDDQYLQGLYLYEKRTPESLSEARRVMLQITSRQPTDGAAWSALAQIYVLQRAYGFENDPRLPENTRAAAAKAIALDSKLAEPHAVLGFYDYFWAHGLSRAAEQEFQRALAINPECAIAHSWYGSMLTYEGRFPEALRELDHAERLQPSSTAILASRALALGLNGRRPEAVALLRQAGGDAPLPSIQYNLGVLAMVPPHDVRLWLDENLRLSESLRPPAYTRLFRAAQQAFRQGGEQAMWRSIAYSHEEAILPSLIADAHLALGETDVAFETLSEAEEQGADNMGSLAMDPLFAPFHEDSRYINLLKKAGIPAS